MSDCPTCGGTGTYWNSLLQERRPCIDCADADVARVMAMSDAEILAEAKRDGVDLDALKAECLEIFERAARQPSAQ